jgi:hypothetical protein
MPDDNQNNNDEPVAQDGQTLQSAYSAEADISLSLSESIANEIDTEILASLLQNGMTSHTFTFNSVCGDEVDTINVTIPVPQAEPAEPVPVRNQRHKIAVFEYYGEGDRFITHIKTVRRVSRTSGCRGWVHYDGGWYPILGRLDTGEWAIAIKQEEFYTRGDPMLSTRRRRRIMRRDGAFEPDPWGNVRYYEEDYNDRT